ncbi:ATP-binding protein [Marinibactrum halimedae]|uniref:ATP-binding protein n=1 Tax=Marinibactrum halimedae TaxID=1444977 RepID=A0AA37T6D6_9GAMM|nr:ATP-binding protein [Marinibactrum halimedae]MCD9458918.1 ATP-binding protein [Marinibactrum halimedae]GLS27765.1 ATP-binding protein [Marinibactrum halimedae]
MGIPVMVIGESGTGKSTSCRNLDPDKTLIVQTVSKPLPFRSSNWRPFSRQTNTGSIIVTDNWESLVRVCDAAQSIGKTTVIFDDFQYLLANEFMRRSGERGFDKFTEIGVHAWEVMRAAQNTQCDTRFYFLQHTATGDDGITRAKTIGKLLDDKITVEGLFTLVMKTVKTDQGYFFSTQNSGHDTVKTPMGLFEQERIDNDLNAVDKAICEYYGLENKGAIAA